MGGGFVHTQNNYVESFKFREFSIEIGQIVDSFEVL